MQPTKIGILGGGQLGKMLCLAAANWDLDTHTLDAARDYPAAPFSKHFVKGDFYDFDDVYAFGKNLDLITIEIEHVNTDALKRLQMEGKVVHPSPLALDIIKDKGRQKQFYADNGIPTAPFRLFPDAEALRSAVAAGELALPFVQKTRHAGYDGRGVAIIRTPQDLAERLLEGPCLAEALADIDKELAVIVARNPSGQTRCFPCVEMAFHPTANLVEFLACPARVSADVAAAAEALALRCIEAYNICGLLAVELFLTCSGELWVNEVAPRTHNSGHHTIDSAVTSQFEQQLRAILDWPLGDTTMLRPAVMLNLLGAEGHSGPVHYAGLAEVLALPGVHVHLYGKKNTKPFRKMGHATIIADSLDEAIAKARQVQQSLRVEAR